MGNASSTSWSLNRYNNVSLFRSVDRVTIRWYETYGRLPNLFPAETLLPQSVHQTCRTELQRFAPVLVSQTDQMLKAKDPPLG